VFYRHVLHNLHINQKARLQSRSDGLKIASNKIDRFVNIDANVFYAQTKADQLQNSFHTSQITLSDTIDIFNKNAAELQLLHLSAKQNHIKQMLQKEQIFTLLVQMVGEYNKTVWKIKKDQQTLEQQTRFSNKLALAVKAGAQPRMEYERFLNLLALLRSRIIEEQNRATTMKNSLALYSNNTPIPELTSISIHGDITQFLKHSPSVLLNDTQALSSAAQTKKLQNSWLPKLILSADQQYNNDPTASGNNYSFEVALGIHFDGGRSKRIEASRIQTLLTQEHTYLLTIKQKSRFQTLLNTSIASKKSIKILKPSIISAQKNLQVMQTAYLKHFITFTSYTQTYQELIRLQEALSNALYRYRTSVALLNNLSQGTIYE
jgi:outer membrane protein TolC